MTLQRRNTKCAAFRPAALSICVACALAASTATAQESATPAAGESGPRTLDIITVTAEKRVEDVRKVPESISTIDQQQVDLIKAGGDDVQFLSARAPR